MALIIGCNNKKKIDKTKNALVINLFIFYDFTTCPKSPEFVVQKKKLHL